jgi:L-fuculose-phosphate aldolase
MAQNRKTLSDPVAHEVLITGEREIVETGSFLSARHYHAALAGNLSTRVSRDHVLCTRHGADKGALSPEDIIICDMDGNKVGGNGEPTSEFSMHRMAYHVRPDIRAVIHAHPPTATAFAAASVPLNELMLPEMVVLLGPVALVPYATPGTQELAEQLKAHLPHCDCFLLENHGALTVGRDLREAALRMELLEHNATITISVRQIGKPFALKPSEMDALMEIRKRINSREEIFG